MSKKVYLKVYYNGRLLAVNQYSDESSFFTDLSDIIKDYLHVGNVSAYQLSVDFCSCDVDFTSYNLFMVEGSYEKR